MLCHSDVALELLWGLFEERGVDLVCDVDLEGIVAKRREGLYMPEETTWVKIKNRMDGRRELLEKRAVSV